MDPNKKYQNVTTFVFDVDGVLTDGNLQAQEDGNLVRDMNTRDGYALKRAIEAGFNICIITGGTSQGVEKRLAKIGVEEIYLGILDKEVILGQYISNLNLDSNEIVYMGDDLPDLEVMKLVYYKACPKDASHEIKKICDYISPIKGGQGCVRDLIEKIMRIQEKW